MVFRKCDIEEILSAAYLPLLFCIISYTLKKIGLFPNFEGSPLRHQTILSSGGPKKFRGFCLQLF